jgi:hypothetical protein
VPGCEIFITLHYGCSSAHGHGASAGFSSTTYEIKGAPSFETRGRISALKQKILQLNQTAARCVQYLLLDGPPRRAQAALET